MKTQLIAKVMRPMNHPSIAVIWGSVCVVHPCTTDRDPIQHVQPRAHPCIQRQDRRHRPTRVPNVISRADQVRADGNHLYRQIQAPHPPIKATCHGADLNTATSSPRPPRRPRPSAPASPSPQNERYWPRAPHPPCPPETPPQNAPPTPPHHSQSRESALPHSPPASARSRTRRASRPYPSTSTESPPPRAAPPPSPTPPPAARSPSALPQHTPPPRPHSHPPPRRAAPAALRQSMATITACAPKLPPISPINSGLAMALELIDTLSAPASNTAEASSAERIPPPTVNGTNNPSAVRFTVSSSVPRPSCVAVMSSSTISSAPPRACRCASSAGSPASTISTNCTPFTTRPPRTSRQAIILFVSIASLTFRQPTSRNFVQT